MVESKKYKGYGFNKFNQKYRARIYINKKEIFLGFYNTAEEAHQAYLDGLVKYNKIERVDRELYIKNNRKRRALYTKERSAQIRDEVIKEYGGICECCGENNVEFLTIDHINGGGTKHRKEIRSTIYRWLKSRNYPKDNFRLLCWNCNCAKGKYGYCPHELNRYQG